MLAHDLVGAALFEERRTSTTTILRLSAATPPSVRRMSQAAGTRYVSSTVLGIQPSTSAAPVGRF